MPQPQLLFSPYSCPAEEKFRELEQLVLCILAVTATLASHGTNVLLVPFRDAVLRFFQILLLLTRQNLEIPSGSFIVIVLNSTVT